MKHWRVSRQVDNSALSLFLRRSPCWTQLLGIFPSSLSAIPPSFLPTHVAAQTFLGRLSSSPRIPGLTWHRLLWTFLTISFSIRFFWEFAVLDTRIASLPLDQWSNRLFLDLEPWVWLPCALLLRITVPLAPSFVLFIFWVACSHGSQVSLSLKIASWCSWARYCQLPTSAGSVSPWVRCWSWCWLRSIVVLLALTYINYNRKVGYQRVRFMRLCFFFK